MITVHETIQLLAMPFLPALKGKVRSDLSALVSESGSRELNLLDVGARRSPYTIGLPAKVTLLDMPRESELQKSRHLGLTDEMTAQLKRRRSNVSEIVFEDMTKCSQPTGTFDGVVSVEVIEHIPDDEAFVEQIARVLKPGGWFYATTPNGDYVKNEGRYYNPAHIRHYTREGLTSLLSRHFTDVKVTYGIKTGKFRYRGLRTLKARHPLAALTSMASNVVSRIESRGLEEQQKRTAHLFAVARKKG